MKNIQSFIALILCAGFGQAINADTLFEKAKEGKINSVKHLALTKQQKIDSIVKGDTALLAAIKNYKEPQAITETDIKEEQEKNFVNYDQVIVFLLSQGASMAIEDQHGRTVFHYAVGLENPHLLKLLLENINRQSERAFNIADHDGRTPLHVAAEQANLEMVKLLCDAGANVDLITRIYAKAPIDVIGQTNKYASAPTKTSIREYLLKCQRTLIEPQPIKRHSSVPSVRITSNLNSLDQKEETENVKIQPLVLTESAIPTELLQVQLLNAIADGDLTTIKRLVEQGASLTIKSDEGLTHLMIAIIFYEEGKQHKKIIEYLIAHEEPLLEKDKEGKTALHYAIEEENLFLINTILNAIKKRSDLDKIIGAQDNRGNTPLHYAAMVTNIPVARLLLMHNASINAQNNERKVPIDVINSKESKVYDRSEKQLKDDVIKMKELLSKHGTVKQQKEKPKHLPAASMQIPITKPKPVSAPAHIQSDDQTEWDLSREGRARSYSIAPSTAIKQSSKKD